MKHLALSCVLSLTTVFSVQAQQMPVYLDDTKPVEQRIEDALSRMTLQFHDWDFLTSGLTMVHTVCAPTCCGTNGTRQDRPTTRVWLSLPLPVLQPPGIHR